MDFSFEHEFSAAPEAVAEALLDEGFQESLKDLEALSDRTVISQEMDGERVVRRTRCVLGVDLGKARAFVGSGDPAWVEVSVWHPDSLEWRWHVEPEIARDLLSASGTIELLPKGSGTMRRVTGVVKVKVPLYGSRVEGWVVDGLRRAYDEEAERLTDHLA